MCKQWPEGARREVGELGITPRSTHNTQECEREREREREKERVKCSWPEEQERERERVKCSRPEEQEREREREREREDSRERTERWEHVSHTEIVNYSFARDGASPRARAGESETAPEGGVNPVWQEKERRRELCSFSAE